MYTPGQDHEALPLATWQALADAARAGGPPSRSVRALLAEIRGDFGADSAFWRRLAARVKRGERFAIERALGGETGDDPRMRRDASRDREVLYEAFNRKWAALNRRCSVARALDRAVPRMFVDDDGVDDLMVMSLKTLVDLALIGAVAKLRDALRERVAAHRLLARVAANRSALPDAARTLRFGGYEKEPGEFLNTYEFDINKALMVGNKTLVAGLTDFLASLPRERPIRPFCATTPFAAEAANRGQHAGEEGEDPCFTGALLGDLVARAVDPDDYAEAFPTAADLDAQMRRCETPTRLLGPLREFRAMLLVLREKFADRADLARACDELRERFEAHFGVEPVPPRAAPARRPMRAPTPELARRRELRRYAAAKALIKQAAIDDENPESARPEDFATRLSALDPAARVIVRRLVDELRAAPEVIRRTRTSPSAIPMTAAQAAAARVTMAKGLYHAIIDRADDAIAALYNHR